MILAHISGHVAVANSVALKKAEIDKSTPNPPGGEIEHDGLGEPTGMLKEAAAMALVKVRIPDPSISSLTPSCARENGGVPRKNATATHEKAAVR